MKEKRLPFKNQLTGKWRIQEIREIFVSLVLVRSRKYFQLFCFNSCPFFYQRTGWALIHEKKDQKENSSFASFSTSSSERSRVSLK